MTYGNPQGRSRTFANAQTGSTATSSLHEDFLLTRVKDYSIATIDNETLLASKGNEDAWMEAATTEIDGALNALTRSLAIGLYRGSDASIGQVSAEPSEATLTVTVKKLQEITNFEVGQVINIWSAKSGGSQRSYDGSNTDMTITDIDRSAGTFTCSAATYDASGTIAADDYIFVKGDRGSGLSGLEDWIPSSAPSATAFFGVDRTSDTVRLGGNRYDGSGVPIEEALIEADAQVSREGGALDHFFMNHKNMGKLKKALGTKVQYVDLQVTPRVSFRGVMVDGENGPIKVVADKNCQPDRIWGLQMDTWKFYSLGPAVRTIDTDSLQLLRQSSADGVEFRAASYSNCGCSGPAYNINVQI